MRPFFHVTGPAMILSSQLDTSCPYDSPLFAVLTVHERALNGPVARLPIALVDELQHLSGANARQLCQMLYIPQGSYYALKRQNALLSSEQSARMLRITALLHRAYLLFHDRDQVLSWLKEGHWDLDGHTPWEMLSTDRGLEEVGLILGVLENGGRSMALSD